MAKEKQQVKTDVFAPSPEAPPEPEQEQQEKGEGAAITVWLQPDIIEDLKKAAKELGNTRSKVMRYAIVEFLKLHKAGKLDLPTKADLS